MKFLDKDIKKYEVAEDSAGGMRGVLKLEFNKPICGTEIMLTREELEYMIRAIDEVEDGEAFGPFKLQDES
jgi:hypothetical protein